MMLRTIGNYKQARLKLDKALALEPDNLTAQYEKEMIEAMEDLDSQIEIQ